MPQGNHAEAMKALELLGHRPIFVEKWYDCAEYELNGKKIELFKIDEIGWLLELEGIITESPSELYSKLLSMLELFGHDEDKLTPIEPATFIFRKKAGNL